MSGSAVFLSPSATKLTAAMRGGVVICGSHGGLYPGYLAAAAGLRAVILSDAGVGLHDAGIASLALLDGIQMAAATVSVDSCRIGDAQDMQARGRISHANEAAVRAGVRPGQRASEAAQHLMASPLPKGKLAGSAQENRHVRTAPGLRRLVLIDSASLVQPEDAGQVIVTGSHGGLVGGVPAMALQVDGYAAFFNDAGVGADRAGLGRLPALETRGIAAVTVAARSARIGEAQSTLDDGVLSYCNAPARALGAQPGMPAALFAQACLRGSHAG